MNRRKQLVGCRGPREFLITVSCREQGGRVFLNTLVALSWGLLRDYLSDASAMLGFGCLNQYHDIGFPGLLSAGFLAILLRRRGNR